MRFCYLVLLAAVTLFAGGNDVAANTAADSKQLAQLDAVRLLAEENEVNVAINRLLKIADTEDEDRAASASFLTKLKQAVWRIKITSWFQANKTPAQVNQIMLKQGSKIDWALATAYASYFRNMKYGPFAIDMYDNVNSRNA
ncbi:hypothetical protein PRNP1_006803 [Phytophthora ramorum]